MDAPVDIELDVAIVGGGCAGLWLLDELRRRGFRALLLEANALGSGQTAAAQGILHGGLKYSLAGLLSASARMVREMPLAWESAIAGTTEPNLSTMRSRARSCFLWRAANFKSWTSMFGAVAALHVRPVELDENEVPAVLKGCPRPIYRLNERVIDPLSLLTVLAERNRGLVWKVDAGEGLQFGPDRILLRRRGMQVPLRLRCKWIVLSAGEGNAELRQGLGLAVDAMQVRPLRVALARGDLPALCGHCVEGAKTRVTITSDVDRQGRTVWQLGGQVTEDGVAMTPEDFLQHAKRELMAVLPSFRHQEVEWTQYTVNRAERRTVGGMMPGDVQVIREGNILTVWPTKLVMAPLLTRRLIEQMGLSTGQAIGNWQTEAAFLEWPAPQTAQPPWEEGRTWKNVS